MKRYLPWVLVVALVATSGILLLYGLRPAWFASLVQGWTTLRSGPFVALDYRMHHEGYRHPPELGRPGSWSHSIYTGSWFYFRMPAGLGEPKDYLEREKDPTALRAYIVTPNGDMSPVSIETPYSTDPTIGAIPIMATYPPGTPYLDLRVVVKDDETRWRIHKLAPTKELIPQNAPAVTTASGSWLTVEGRASTLAKRSPNDAPAAVIALKLKGNLDPTLLWEWRDVRSDHSAAPSTFDKGRGDVSTTAAILPGGSKSKGMIFPLPYASLYRRIHVGGAVVGYRTFEEPVSFGELSVVPKADFGGRSENDKDRRNYRPNIQKPVRATMPSGLKLALLPEEGKKSNENFLAWGTNLYCRLSIESPSPAEGLPSGMTAGAADADVMVEVKARGLPFYTTILPRTTNPEPKWSVILPIPSPTPQGTVRLDLTVRRRVAITKLPFDLRLPVIEGKRGELPYFEKSTGRSYSHMSYDPENPTPPYARKAKAPAPPGGKDAKALP